MARHRKTEAYLRLAEQDAELAHRLLRQDPPPLRWVAVMAFDAAVNYIAAYLWEHLRHETQSHQERARFVRGEAVLMDVADNYERLYQLGRGARYDPYFRLNKNTVDDLLNIDLVQVKHMALRHLPPPE